MPRTDEVALMAEQAGGVESLGGTILLDRYRLIELRGSGGAAVVYEAEHTMMHRRVAVKILHPEVAARQDFVRRFLAEARTVAKLRHEHIVDVIDIGRTETGLVFCVMEYLEGESLADTLERGGPMPLPRAQRIVAQVCTALAAAHAAGVVHRDVKPDNCFRTRRGNDADFVKLLDFGIAKQLDVDKGLTATGVIMGTAEYMSPEQARGSSGVDARADIYSVGAMLFELLTGRPPYEGVSFLDVLMQHASAPIPRISALSPHLPRALDDVIERALAKRPNDRFLSVEALASALVSVSGLTVVVRASEVHPRSPHLRAPEWTLAQNGPPSARHPGLGRAWPTIAALVVGVAALVGTALGVSTILDHEVESEPVAAQRTNADEQSISGGAEIPASRTNEPETSTVRDELSGVGGLPETPHAGPVAPDVAISAADHVAHNGVLPEHDAAPPRARSDRRSDGRAQRKGRAGRSPELERRIAGSCMDFVHRKTRVTVQALRSGATTVRVIPAYPLLRGCIEKVVQGLPEGEHTASLTPPAN